MGDKEFKSVAQIAFRDISQHMKEQKIQVFDNNKDVWFVTPSRMNDKKTRSLNKLLGLSSLNYYNNTNGRVN